MRITNTTDKNNNGGVKVIGLGDFSILPGETKDVPDSIAYVPEFDKNGKPTGKKVVLPAIRTLAKLGQVFFEETKDAEKPAEEKKAPKQTDEEKKAAAAAKRAAARAANKAAKAAAEAAAAETAE